MKSSFPSSVAVMVLTATSFVASSDNSFAQSKDDQLQRLEAKIDSLAKENAALRERMRRIESPRQAGATPRTEQPALNPGLSANAAAFPTKAFVPPRSPCAQFGGFYAGGNAGWGYHDWKVHDLDSLAGNTSGELPANPNGSSDGFVGGGQIGYNWQRGCTIFGVEADWSWANLSSSEFYTTGDPPFSWSTVNAKVDWFGTLRTRFGVIVDDVLLYVTGGLAFTKIKYTNGFFQEGDNDFEQFTHSDKRWGWAAGLGGEWAWTPNLSIKSELLYLRFKESGTAYTSLIIRPGDPPYDFKFEDSVWVSRIGINYRFGDFGKGPVVSRY